MDEIVRGGAVGFDLAERGQRFGFFDDSERWDTEVGRLLGGETRDRWIRVRRVVVSEEPFSFSFSSEKRTDVMV